MFNNTKRPLQYCTVYLSQSEHGAAVVPVVDVVAVVQLGQSLGHLGGPLPNLEQRDGQVGGPALGWPGHLLALPLLNRNLKG